MSSTSAVSEIIKMVEQENMSSNEIKEIIAFSVRKLLQNPDTERVNIDKLFSDYIKEYNENIIGDKKKISKEYADAIFKPIFWYLSDKKAIEYTYSDKKGACWKIAKQEPKTIENIIEGILSKYGKLIKAKLERLLSK